MKSRLLPLFRNFSIFVLLSSCVTGLFPNASAQEIYSLPFNEGWTSGNFSLNQWQAGQSWSVFGQMGTPLPAVKFKWDPILENYSSSLESQLFGVKTGSGTTGQSIWLDFNLTLNDRTSLGNEKLFAETWNGKHWTTIAEFQNKGSFNWITQHIDITEMVNKNAFKIRFTATGRSSKDILFWMIDNIMLSSDDRTRVFTDSPISSVKSTKSLPLLKSTEVAMSDNSFSENSIKTARNLVGYNIYRREYLDPIPYTGYTTLSDWHMLNNSPVTSTDYWDYNLAYNCYDYYVTAVYTEGESVPSNIDAWNCFVYISVDEPEVGKINLYPNPALSYLEIDFPKNIHIISIYNALGSLILEKEVKGTTHITILTSEYPAGTYFVRLADDIGLITNRKFLVIK